MKPTKEQIQGAILEAIQHDPRNEEEFLEYAVFELKGKDWLVAATEEEWNEVAATIRKVAEEMGYDEATIRLACRLQACREAKAACVRHAWRCLRCAFAMVFRGMACPRGKALWEEFNATETAYYAAGTACYKQIIRKVK